MVKRTGIFICCLLAINYVESQKIVKRSIINPETNFIQIDVTKCFQLNMETSELDELMVEAIIDGEYQKDLLLDVIEDGQTVKVNTEFQPSFINPNDKLSAHKVISIALNIKVPKNMKVQIFGSSCNVEISGNYRSLSVTLGDGKCTLDKVGEEVFVATQSGDINIKNPKGEVDATTKYGKVFKKINQEGDNHYKVSSVTGNIYLSKTE